MPVDYRPIVVLVTLVALPATIFAFKQRVMAFLIAAAEVMAVGIYIHSCLSPPRRLLQSALDGSPKAQFELSRWYAARQCFGQGCADRYVSWKWLERSAENQYPPAIYSEGVLYKMGVYLPIPSTSDHIWMGAPHADINRGQALIDRAIGLGFQPPSKEEWFYATVFSVPSRSIAGTKDSATKH